MNAAISGSRISPGPWRPPGESANADQGCPVFFRREPLMACRNQAIIGLSSLGYAAEAATSRATTRSPLELCRAVLPTWLARARERNALSDLDDRLLDDIGLGREAAEREWRKPFWRADGSH